MVEPFYKQSSSTNIDSIYLFFLYLQLWSRYQYFFCLSTEIQHKNLTMKATMLYIQEKYKSNNQKSFYNSFKFLMKFANCLGLLPLTDTSSINTIRYNWKSWKSFYAILITLTCVINTIIAIANWTVQKFSFRDFVRQLNQINGFISLILYFQLAKKWPKLMKVWNEIDRKMTPVYGYPKKFDFKIRFYTVIAVILVLVEYIFLTIYQYKKITRKEDFKFRNYYETAFPEFFSVIPFNVITALFATVTSIIGHLIWSFNDLFIIVISSTLASRFKQITDRLYSGEKKANSNNYWIEIRVDYDRLVNLSRKLDKYISYIVLLSYSTNIFFLLIQLSNVIGHFKYRVQIIYYGCSFLFLIIRLCAVSLYGAWIIDESKEPANSLHCVPSATYNPEIRRLLLQINFNDVGLTGSKMFRVTRSLILNVAGAIVTYELVIIQFNNTQGLK